MVKVFTGTLIGINPDNLSLALADAKEEGGKTVNRFFLNGSTVAQFPLQKNLLTLKRCTRLEKVFPTMVKLYEDKGFIWLWIK
jgi:hypothetical protein